MKHNCVRILLALTISTLSACGKDGRNNFQIDIVNPLDEGRDIEMVTIPGGSYIMGSNLDSLFTIEITPVGSDTTFNPERPVHVVTVSSFLISSTEITQEQYKAIMGSNPSQFSGELNLPVEKVSWYDAADFCNELSSVAGLNKCYTQFYDCDYSANGFRLPTEAEWEYAARGGSNSEYFFGDDLIGMNQAGWYIGNSENKSHQVATRNPNNFGLYDMHGNVNEWTQDNYNFYSCGAQADPTGPVRGYQKSVRGGSWASAAKGCRSAQRFAYDPKSHIITLGFRIVRRP